jgi:hypothetical protein
MNYSIIPKVKILLIALTASAIVPKASAGLTSSIVGALEWVNDSVIGDVKFQPTINLGVYRHTDLKQYINGNYNNAKYQLTQRIVLNEFTGNYSYTQTIQDLNGGSVTSREVFSTNYGLGRLVWREQNGTLDILRKAWNFDVRLKVTPGTLVTTGLFPPDPPYPAGYSMMATEHSTSGGSGPVPTANPFSSIKGDSVNPSGYTSSQPQWAQHMYGWPPAVWVGLPHQHPPLP